MAIIRSFSTFANAQINAYRGLAQKAWGGDPIGNRDSRVVAALKQFFYNLDFLLKYGHFPSVEDTAQNALPKELRGLKEFLETSPCKGKSYILQKDINTRYRFTRSKDDKVTVAVEVRYSSPTGARTDIWSENISQTCKKNELLSFLNGVNQTSTEEPAEGLATEEEPAEGQTSAEKPAEVQTSAEKPAEGLATEEEPAEVQTSAEKPAEGLATEEEPAEGLATEEEPAEVQTSAEKPAEGLATEEEPAEGRRRGVVYFTDAGAPYPKRHAVIFNAKTRMIIWDDGSQSVLPPDWDMRFALDQVTKQQIDSFVKQQDT